MSEGIIVALIGFAGLIITTIITNIVTSSNNSKKLMNQIKTENSNMIGEIRLELTEYKATTNEQIKELTREVREHNNFAKRMPVVENDIKHIVEDIKKYHREN